MMRPSARSHCVHIQVSFALSSSGNGSPISALYPSNSRFINRSSFAHCVQTAIKGPTNSLVFPRRFPITRHVLCPHGQSRANEVKFLNSAANPAWAFDTCFVRNSCRQRGGMVGRDISVETKTRSYSAVPNKHPRAPRPDRLSRRCGPGWLRVPWALVCGRRQPGTVLR